MKSDIVLAGVGGQGILTIAAILGAAALKNDLYLKQAEVHGMSQRGGDVQSNLRISSSPIHSDLIPLGKADMIVSLEPMEALRYLPYLSEEGWIVSNTTPFVNIDDYPANDELEKCFDTVNHKIVFDMDGVAKALASPRSSNMVLLGAATSLIDLPVEIIEKEIAAFFGKKGDKIIEANIAAFREGYRIAQEQK